MSFNRLAVHGHRGWASSCIVQALADSGAPVRVIARPESDTTGLPAGVTAVTVDLADQQALISALKDIDILISLVGHQGVQSQHSLVEAIPHTDVKLFVPSDMGFQCDEQGLTVPILRAKADVEEAANKLGVPITKVLPAFITESSFSTSMMGIDYEGNRIVYMGDSEHQRMTTATREYVAAAYTSLFSKTPVSELQNRAIGLSEIQPTGADIAAALHKRHGRAPQVLRQSLASVDEQIQSCLRIGHPLALSWYCRRTWATGKLIETLGGDIYDVPGYSKATLDDLLVQGKLEQYKGLPPPVLEAFNGMFEKATP